MDISKFDLKGELLPLLHHPKTNTNQRQFCGVTERIVRNLITIIIINKLKFRNVLNLYSLNGTITF
ncbi:hypothetical protein ERO13_D07G022750v2 [Gossypium hirsutum]|uniref:Uncharacterized protein n=2 Tax=Gossypium TaxID=3633 RepID=A0A5J5QLI5_GOSBA|nr:hypothetical protein ES319_D07G022500v1 [Gossypium barbadense]KAG4136690.1 hypothetical protein ERO13_D07G022750v2 [Gossypium hirsutum]TYI71930.1 hypothetical protein E1A91_D07G024200v1 [Gossypium mustelinum]